MADFAYLTDGMFRPDVVAIVAGAPTLVGSQCTVCNDLRFPRAQACPRCHAPVEQLISCAFARRGKLVTCCRIERGPAGFRVPYLVGYVQLEGGPRVLAQICSDVLEPAELIGRGCTVEVGPLSDASAGPVLGYRFSVDRA